MSCEYILNRETLFCFIHTRSCKIDIAISYTKWSKMIRKKTYVKFFTKSFKIGLDWVTFPGLGQAWVRRGSDGFWLGVGKTFSRDFYNILKPLVLLLSLLCGWNTAPSLLTKPRPCTKPITTAAPPTTHLLVSDSHTHHFVTFTSLYTKFPTQIPRHFSYQLHVKYLVLCHFNVL